MKNLTDKNQIQNLVVEYIQNYATEFKNRHLSEVDDPNGTINMKVHNMFIEALGKDVQYYAALVRSLDSSLGNMLEDLAIDLAKFSFRVKKDVAGPLDFNQTQQIALLLEEYKRHNKKPQVSDYAILRTKIPQEAPTKRHDSDYYLFDESTNKHYLIELKIGGDLDNKKARSEKEAILEQYAILSNTLPPDASITIYFATAYNRFGEDKVWKQERVRQFFAEDELLIGRDFWNFICQSDSGYNWVSETYRANAYKIKDALSAIKLAYIG